MMTYRNQNLTVTVYTNLEKIWATDFSDYFRIFIICNKLNGYNLNMMRKSECLVVNPNTVHNLSDLFYCTPVDRASGSMRAPT